MSGVGLADNVYINGGFYEIISKSITCPCGAGAAVAVGCKQPVDLSMQRNRIFLLGRLLVGQTCDVRLIWRKAPDDPVPVTVTADLSEIGG